MTKILLVDDEPDIIFTTKVMLEKSGYKVMTATNSDECLEEMAKDQPDLILLDIMMPGISGWETCKKIKEDPKTKNIPVAMFTVRTSEDSVQKSKEYAHADAQINKPFKMEELLELVKGLLKKS